MSSAGPTSRPPDGHTVLTTRARPESPELVTKLRETGARVAHVPLTRQRLVEGGDGVVRAIARGWATDVVFTSANAVRFFAEAPKAADFVAQHTTWAVGPATAARLADALGATAQHVPAADASADGLVELAANLGVAGRRFLFPAARGARPTLRRGLEELGAEVEQLIVYETVPDPDAPERLQVELTRASIVVALASPSAAEALCAALDELEVDRRQRIAAIGATTAKRATELGLNVAAVAQPHTMAGLVEAIVRLLTLHRR